NAGDLSGITLSGGNLTATYASTTNAQVRSVAGHSTGKYHFEFTIGSMGGAGVDLLGIASASHVFSNYCGQDLNSCAANDTGADYLNAAPIDNERDGIGNPMTWTAGDVVAMEVDLDGSTIKWQNFTQHPGAWTNAPRDISTMTN